MHRSSDPIRIRPEWIDHNGHLNVAYFVLAFDMATDAVYEEWGIGLAYQEQSGCSVYTLGMNVDYLKELFADEEVRVKTQLLGLDRKKIHYVHSMLHAGTGELAAVNECLAINVRLASKRSAPFPSPVQRRLEELYEQHETLDKPARCGRSLGIDAQAGTSKT